MLAILVFATAVLASSTAPSAAQLRHDALLKAGKAGMKAYYPEAAQRARVEGTALVDCAILPDGYVDDCKLVSEEPAGFGFGAKALEMAPLFKMKSPVTPGARSVIPLKFKLSQ